MAQITGWGRSTWGSATWNESIPVETTGISSQTSVGTTETKIAFSVEGIGLSTTLGNVVVQGTANIELNQSLSMALSLGDESAFTDITVSLSGFSLTMSIAEAEVTAWREVDTGTSSSWTPVDFAA